MAASALADPEPSKVVQKRSGLVGHYGVSAPLIGHSVGLGHGLAIGHGHLEAASYSLGHGHIAGPIGYSAGYGPGFAGAFGPVVSGPAGPAISGAIVGANVHTTVTKHVGVPVPAPYPVAVDRPVPVPVKVSYTLRLSNTLTLHFNT